MNTATHASTTSSTATTASPTPVEFFEQNARKVWKSKLAAGEKAEKLTQLSDSIDRYLLKARKTLDDRAPSQDHWTQMACERATQYLETLANDVKHLAVECQQKANRGDA